MPKVTVSLFCERNTFEKYLKSPGLSFAWELPVVGISSRSEGFQNPSLFYNVNNLTACFKKGKIKLAY